ncbi:hypothetical protein OG749_36480 [Streptomyces nojiriensis]|uniref:hypothetical protein n=1 Tax=Streptomyces nojiriensis TaxID=66374 RepID=UPI002E18A09B
MSSTLPALPPVGTLTEDQVRGAACVWCGIVLDNGTAVDLGEQLARIADHVVRWFPRACRQHP